MLGKLKIFPGYASRVRLRTVQRQRLVARMQRSENAKDAKVKINHADRAHPVGATGRSPLRKGKASFTALILWLIVLLLSDLQLYAQQDKKPLERVRLTVPAKSLTFIPYYFGRAQGIFAKEGIDLEIIVMRPPLGVTALVAGDLDYTAAGGLSIRAAIKGVPLRTITFIQTRLSFSLIGQPGMTPAKIKNVAVSGIGSLAHYAATTVMKRLGNEKVAYISTNTTGNSYTALLAKAADAAILSPPYTSMATLAGHPDLGNTFDVRDLQGGLVTRVSHIQDRRRYFQDPHANRQYRRRYRRTGAQIHRRQDSPRVGCYGRGAAGPRRRSSAPARGPEGTPEKIGLALDLCGPSGPSPGAGSVAVRHWLKPAFNGTTAPSPSILSEHASKGDHKQR